MSDPNPLPNFPTHQPPAPQGIPVADPSNSRFLFKAIRSMARTMQRHPKVARAKKGVESSQSVHIKRRKQIFY